MSSFFNMDNPFFRAMSRVADLMILNIIFVVCCIPVVTIGPALTGLFYTTLKMVRNEESYIVRGFFHSFKENLKQGIIINLIMIAAGVLLFLDRQIVRSSIGGTVGNVMLVVFGAMAVFYLMVFIYIYPVLARFYNTIKNTFINSLLMSIRHLPYTFLMMIVTVLPFGILYLPQGVAAVQSILMLLMILMGFAAIAYCNSFFLVKIFDNYMPKEEEGEAPKTEDAWDGPAGLSDSIPGIAGNPESNEAQGTDAEAAEPGTEAAGNADSSQSTEKPIV